MSRPMSATHQAHSSLFLTSGITASTCPEGRQQPATDRDPARTQSPACTGAWKQQQRRQQASGAALTQTSPCRPLQRLSPVLHQQGASLAAVAGQFTSSRCFWPATAPCVRLHSSCCCRALAQNSSNSRRRRALGCRAPSVRGPPC